jgi:hypothetical protein
VVCPLFSYRNQLSSAFITRKSIRQQEFLHSTDYAPAPAVVRDGVRHWLQSSNNQVRAVRFGAATDRPIPGLRSRKTGVCDFHPKVI